MAAISYNRPDNRMDQRQTLGRRDGGNVVDWRTCVNEGEETGDWIRMSQHDEADRHNGDLC